MISYPNAKINLGLNIVERRPDGYHNLETLFYPIGLTDVLEIVPARGESSTLTCYGNDVQCPPEKNLVMKALRLMQSQLAVPEVDIHLCKHIPHGAGLGGGSSDASSTLLMLNEMFDLGATREQLAAMAAQLGADCPFFIYNTPMIATGIGDVLSPVNVDLKRKWLLLIKPEVSVPTAVAYSRVSPHRPRVSLRDTVLQPLESWQDTVKNDFEQSVFAVYPQLAAIKQTLLDSGAVYAAMSGSGSSIFGIFNDARMAGKTARALDKEAHFVIAL